MQVGDPCCRPLKKPRPLGLILVAVVLNILLSQILKKIQSFSFLSIYLTFFLLNRICIDIHGYTYAITATWAEVFTCQSGVTNFMYRRCDDTYCPGCLLLWKGNNGVPGPVLSCPSIVMYGLTSSMIRILAINVLYYIYIYISYVYTYKYIYGTVCTVQSKVRTIQLLYWYFKLWIVMHVRLNS